MSLEPGRYRAFVEDYGIRTVGEKNTPQLSIKFKTKDSGQGVYFQNFLTAKTTVTDYWNTFMDTITGTGLLRSKRFTDIAKGVDGGALDKNVELEIIVDYQRDEQDQVMRNDKGEAYLRVSFVNDPNKSGMKGLLAESEAVTVLAGLNLDAHILQSEQRTGAQISQAPAQHTPNVASDDIPF